MRFSKGLQQGMKLRWSPSTITSKCVADGVRIRRLLSRAPEDVVGKGGTPLSDVLYAGLKLMDQSFERPTVLLFTDGQDVHSRLTESEVWMTVKESVSGHLRGWNCLCC